MPPTTFACPSCRISLHLAAEAAGRKVRCTRCGHVFVPGAIETAPTDEQTLADLVSLWQRRRAEGRSAQPAELCRDRPDLLPELQRRLDALQRINGLAATPERTTAPASPSPVREQATLDTQDTRPPSQPSAPSTAASGAAGGPSVPGYEVLGVLGQGGMGVVYKARQLGLNRTIALKMILHAEHASEEQRRRFRAEAEAVARLQHANIVQVHEVGEHNGLPFFSLEFCPGGSLADKLDGTPLPPTEAARLVQTLAQAMQAAHKAGVVHRDLKPANVLLAEDGTPKVTDFGLAKTLDVQGQTQTGAVMGTPSYMAPEQALGQKDVGPAADVYALGAILYELLTGRPPFKAATALDTLFQLVSDEPAPPSQLQSKTPRDLETIALKCLHKEPGKRYGSAEELAVDLERYLRGEPIAARPVGRLERSWRWCRRNPALAIQGAAMILLFLGAFALVTWKWLDAEFYRSQSDQARADAEEHADQEAHAKTDAEARKREAEDARTDAETRKREAEQAQRDAEAALAQSEVTSYRSGILLAEREIDAGNPNHADEVLSGLPPRLRCWEWRHLKRMTHPEALTALVPTRYDVPGGVVIQLGATARAVTYSPDGALLVVGDSSGSLHFFKAATGERLTTLESPKGFNHLNAIAFHPKGTLIAAGGSTGGSKDSKGVLALWDVPHLRMARRIGNLAGSVTALAFSPDGELLAAGQRETAPEESARVVLRNAATGEDVRSLKSSLGDITSVAFSSDSKSLAAGASSVKTKTGSRTGGAQLWEVASGRSLWARPGDDRDVHSLAFNPDGKTLALGCGEQGLILADPKTGEGKRPTVNVPDARHLAYTPAGDELVAGGERDIRICQGQSLAQIAVLHGHKATIRHLAIHPGGRWLASVADENLLKVWPIRPLDGPELSYEYETKQLYFRPFLFVGATPKTTRWAHDLVHALAFSPDGKHLVAALTLVGEGPAVVWEADSGRVLLSLRHPKGQVNDVAYSHDGSYLATAGEDGSVRLWEPNTGAARSAFEGHRRPVQHLAVHPTGRLVASADWDDKDRVGCVKVWDVGSGTVAFGWDCTVPVSGLAFSPDGRRLACARGMRVATEKNEVSLRDAASGEVLTVLQGFHDFVQNLAFHPDGRRLATAGGTQPASVWDAATGALLLRLPGTEDRTVNVTFLEDGRRLATASQVGNVKLWDADTADPVATLAVVPGDPEALNFLMGGSVLAYNPATDRLAAAVDGGFRIKIWEVDRGGGSLLSLSNQGTALVFAENGRQLVTASDRGADVQTWGVPDGRRRGLVSLGGSRKLQGKLAFSPDARHLATTAPPQKEGSGPTTPGEVVLWNARTGRQLTQFRMDSKVGALRFTPDGTRMAVGGHDKITRVWPVDGGQGLTLRGHSDVVFSAAFSPDGRWLATGSRDRTIRVWDAASGAHRQILFGHAGDVDGLAFNPDGERLASTGTDCTVRVWDWRTGRTVLNLKGQRGSARNVAFSPDGHWLASGSDDRAARVWDAATGQLLQEFRHSDEVHQVAFSPDGRYLASADKSGHVRLWDLEPIRNAPPSPGRADDLAQVAASLPQPFTDAIPAGRKNPLRTFTNSVGMRLVEVPAGKFTMGSPADEPGRGRDEQAHEVEISRPFYGGAFEVTQEEFQQVMGFNPSSHSAQGEFKAEFQGMDTRRFPVDSVTWTQAVEFCARLSRLPDEKRLGRVYRLPTEAQWEWARRSGSKGPGGVTLAPTRVGMPLPVGTTGLNGFGISDMHGSLWEWCSDWYAPYSSESQKDPQGPRNGRERVLRGPAWSDNGGPVHRIAVRYKVPPNAVIRVGKKGITGFRVICDISAPAK